MARKEGIFESLRVGVKSEEEIAVEALFPARNKFQMLQMITDHQMKAMVPLAILGMFRRIYKSKVLEIFQEEINFDKVGLDRLGRVELSELMAARKMAREKEED